MPKVTFVKEKQEVEVPEGANLRREAMKAGVSALPRHQPLPQLPGSRPVRHLPGSGQKGHGEPQHKTLIEARNLAAHPLTMFAAIGHEDEMRLACQVHVNGDCAIETKPALNVTGENFWQKPYPNK